MTEKNCSAPCEEACVRAHQVPVHTLMTRLCAEVTPELEVPAPISEDALRTDICGVPLENPFLLSFSVVASTYDMCARAFDAGWAGVAFKVYRLRQMHDLLCRWRTSGYSPL